MFGLLGGILLSAIFGIIALRRVKRGAGGKGMAIAGLVLSGLWTLVWIAILAGVILTSASRDSSGEVQRAGSSSIDDLTVGDCLRTFKETDWTLTVPVVPCSEPHEAEIYHQFELPSGSYPGDDEIQRQAEDQCAAIGQSVLPESRLDTLEVAYFHPTARSWQQGVSRIDCLAVNTNGKSTDSLLP